MMSICEKLLLALFLFLVIIQLCILIFARNFQSFENFEDDKMVSNLMYRAKQEIENVFDKDFDYNVSSLHKFWEQNQNQSALVVIKNGKYEIKYNNSELEEIIVEKFIEFMRVLKSLHPNLPDCTFVQFFGDGQKHNNLPVFQNSVKDSGILSPFWFMFSEGKIESVKEHTTPFIINKAVWRGTGTGDPNAIWGSRRYITETALDFPKFIDAKFVNHLTHENIMTPEEQLNYRFIISKDGNGGTYGLYWQLVSGRCVLLNSCYKQWFTPFFKENVHYISYNDENSGNQNLKQIISETPLAKTNKIGELSKNQSTIVFDKRFVFWYTLQLLNKLSSFQNVIKHN